MQSRQRQIDFAAGWLFFQRLVRCERARSAIGASNASARLKVYCRFSADIRKRQCDSPQLSDGRIGLHVWLPRFEPSPRQRRFGGAVQPDDILRKTKPAKIRINRIASVSRGEDVAVVAPACRTTVGTQRKFPATGLTAYDSGRTFRDRRHDAGVLLFTVTRDARNLRRETAGENTIPHPTAIVTASPCASAKRC